MGTRIRKDNNGKPVESFVVGLLDADALRELETLLEDRKFVKQQEKQAEGKVPQDLFREASEDDIDLARPAGLQEAEDEDELQDGEYRQTEALSRNEKAQIGLTFLEELTGDPVAAMANGEFFNADLLNLSLSRIYVGKKSLNPDGELLTEENWQEQMAAFADRIADYLDYSKEDRHFALHKDLDPICVLKDGRFYGLRAEGETARETLFWTALDDAAQDAEDEGAFLPTLREQIDLMAKAGTHTDTGERPELLDRVSAEITNIYNEYGQADLKKLDDLLEAVTDYQVENSYKRGEELLEHLPDFEQFQELDAKGAPKTVTMKNGCRMTIPEILARDCVTRSGYASGQGDIIDTEVMHAVGGHLHENDKLWESYLAYKGIPTKAGEPVIDFKAFYEQMRDRKAAQMKKAEPEKARALDLGMNCSSLSVVKYHRTEEQKAFCENYNEKYLAETEKRYQKDWKITDHNLPLLKPDFDEDLARNMDKLLSLGEQFKLADHWYHKNHKAYNDLVLAIDMLSEEWLALDAKKKVLAEQGKAYEQDLLDNVGLCIGIERVKRYLNLYLGDKEKARGTDLGKDRYSIAMSLAAEISPELYTDLEHKHNAYREAHQDSRRVSLQDLQDRVGRHAETHETDLNKKVTQVKNQALKAEREKRKK